jgi:hypothetical protein
MSEMAGVTEVRMQAVYLFSSPVSGFGCPKPLLRGLVFVDNPRRRLSLTFHFHRRWGLLKFFFPLHRSSTVTSYVFSIARRALRRPVR